MNQSLVETDNSGDTSQYFSVIGNTGTPTVSVPVDCEALQDCGDLPQIAFSQSLDSPIATDPTCQAELEPLLHDAGSSHHITSDPDFMDTQFSVINGPSQEESFDCNSGSSSSDSAVGGGISHSNLTEPHDRPLPDMMAATSPWQMQDCTHVNGGFRSTVKPPPPPPPQVLL